MSGISDESNQSWPNCWYSQTAIKVTVDDVYHALPEIRPSAMREIFLKCPKYIGRYWGQEELKRKLIEVVQLPLEASDSFKT